MSSKRHYDELDNTSSATANTPRKVQRKEPTLSSTTSSSNAQVSKPSALYISIDYGTKNLAVSYRLGELDEDIGKIEIVQYSYMCPQAPQRAAWFSDGTFVWGHVSATREASGISCANFYISTTPTR